MFLPSSGFRLKNASDKIVKFKGKGVPRGWVHAYHVQGRGSPLPPKMKLRADLTKNESRTLSEGF